ncbi:MAG: hypothetical protein JWM73_1164 [Solirubrobacterales bacterium]|nr:hypothetical protein [Solirubrobacterales bacterium]
MALEQRIEWLEQRPSRTVHLAMGSLACPGCDAPVAPAAGTHAPSDPLGCPYCGLDGAVRDFLSLAQPTRPARVVVRARL